MCIHFVFFFFIICFFHSSIVLKKFAIDLYFGGYAGYYCGELVHIKCALIVVNTVYMALPPHSSCVIGLNLSLSYRVGGVSSGFSLTIQEHAARQMRNCINPSNEIVHVCRLQIHGDTKQDNKVIVDEWMNKINRLKQLFYQLQTDTGVDSANNNNIVYYTFVINRFCLSYTYVHVHIHICKAYKV